MKNILVLILLASSFTGCGSIKPATSTVREQTIGSVQISYDDEGNWIKIESSGVEALHNSSARSVTEAAKVAQMHAKQNISDFMSNNINSEKTADTTSTSKVHAVKDGEKRNDEMDTITVVVERIRDNSTAILRGVQVVDQRVTREFVRVDVAATRKSIAAATSIKNSMSN